MTMNPTAATHRPAQAGAWRMSDRAVETLKAIALVAMTLDHVNKYLLEGSQPWMFAIGRVAAPIFAVVLGYNLARAGAVASNAATRTAGRLFIVGAVASVPYIGLGHTSAGGWWPLNVLFALAVACPGIALWDRGRRRSATTLIAVGGALTEFFWPLIGLTIAAHRLARAPSAMALGAGTVACALLTPINGNGWALAALPMIAVASCLPQDAKASPARRRWIYYAYYPAHLAVLWFVRALVDAV